MRATGAEQDIAARNGIGAGHRRVWRRAAVALGACVWMGLVPMAEAQTGWRGASVPARPGLAPDPIEQSRALSTRSVPVLPPAPVPDERVVSERRVRVPGTDREIVVPSHQERLLPDGQWQSPPLTGYGTRGEGPIHLRELRQAP